MAEKAAAFVIAVCDQDFSAMSQEHEDWGIFEIQAPQGLLRTQPFIAFPAV